ncbi:hypothetical protein PP935_gp169 [Rhizobium phage RHph_N34]|uniref:Uncharacterized protein n=1 Tax=Rhizobium phage RHph_N34 TaxID=2509586 RepID=A0A7S5UYI3_9CAUD|nr:hypothetical protein PP935_gp169 [Rhizobium phage RHph_N34]QIG73944.1 hypothetical protein EVC06_169 [Rhizobium phage RHph_N34]
MINLTASVICYFVYSVSHYVAFVEDKHDVGLADKIFAAPTMLAVALCRKISKA